LISLHADVSIQLATFPATRPRTRRGRHHR